MSIDTGTVCKIKALKSAKGKLLAEYLLSVLNPYAKLVQTGKTEQTDIIGVEVSLSVPQIKHCDIRPQEPLIICFKHCDDTMPEVYAMREGFPRNIPHLNLLPKGYPPSLCLYNEKYADIKPSWTPQRFIERIRLWLENSADGTLHKDDQPLEPFLASSRNYIFIPDDTFADNNVVGQLAVVDGSLNGTSTALRVSSSTAAAEQSRIKFTAIRIIMPTQQHGVINHAPDTLHELHELLNRAGFDLLSYLRTEMRSWFSDDPSANSRRGGFALIGCIPKTRTTDAPPETGELFAFATVTCKIEEVLEDIGVIAKGPEGRYGLLMNADETKQGASTKLDLLNPIFELSRKRAAALNGVNQSETKIFAIGAGAIGSQIVMNSVRSGFGEWSVIDNDILLPHNLARHALNGKFLGRPKADALQEFANENGYKSIIEAINTDFLRPEANKKENVEKAAAEAEIILDMSASVAVAKHATQEIQSPARRISAFLNPAGNHLVIIAEDKQRNYRLDYLEMEYYLAISTDKSLTRHLADIGKVRYANSCRDVSAKIPQDFVSLHAAIASRTLKNIAASEKASIQIFRLDPESLEVSKAQVSVGESFEDKVGGWTIRVNENSVEKLFKLRNKKLPSETGGIMIGAVDMENKTVSLVDILSAPADSMEYPYAFIRGQIGLLDNVQEVEKKTAGKLTYIGEWHSHPDKTACWPSSDDKEVFKWISEHVAAEGLPAIMLIAGDKRQLCCCIENKIKVLEFPNGRSKLEIAV